MSDGEHEVAVFGGGCFWCTEAVFDELRGVISVVSGYAGGRTKNPAYEQVCMGITGHAEVRNTTPTTPINLIARSRSRPSCTSCTSNSPSCSNRTAS
ncbi:MAG: peptide-methionine (S)-S-oxide reductase [Deltaproteobacteria bacterium]|nr:peptide-methionine (S)-S-oxide reductase [Deltaproteobacteria bacterium]